ncbi:hypoxia-inducible factor 1-alpha-like isoform X2 [Diachasmimorpha longicaudata]|uniref:hypoxia-inducible factor 1-alpha-like isoform X2 n=1 Tax=Diachasmimorpha longicaudata TaxID=58733 RepID=UPI0030B89004
MSVYTSKQRKLAISWDVQSTFGIPCTEAQWLTCPVTNCPVFDDTTRGQGWNWNLTPAYPNVRLDRSLEECQVYRGNYGGYCPLVNDDEDGQSFEDYLNNEKRKEKSRDAARCRRSRETDIFAELAAELPISQEQAQHLDKASVMRLAIAYLKARSVIDGLSEPLPKAEKISEMDMMCQEALDGFVLVLANNGDMVYLSENVSDYLGIPQMDMMGQSVFEYGHPCDHEEIRQCLSMTAEDVNEKRSCNFFLRLKCTLTSKGRKVNLKSASYKVIHCVGHPMISRQTVSDETEELDEGIREFSGCGSSGSGTEDSQDGSDKTNVKPSTGISLVVVGCPIPHPSNIEVPLGRHTFLSKHNLNMKFTYADDRLSEYLGWSSNELMGKSVFDFHHALDNSALNKSFKSLFSKGQCETVAYRFLSRTGGYAWVVTQATLIRCTKQNKPLSVVCVNHILSGIECKDEVYSVRQLEARSAAEKLEKFSKTEGEDILLSPPAPIEPEKIPVEVEPIIPVKRTRPQTVTASLFKDLDPEEGKGIPRINDIAGERREKRSPWLFQDKPVVDYDPSRHRALTRSQAATRTSLSAGQDNQLITGNCRPPPQTATASIFAPRTEEMNTGFLIFSEDQPGLTMLKDEPEDLTHLAPTPGDVCVPLEDTPFLSDMLDEFILGNDVYCPLLSPSLPAELPSGSELSDDSDKSPESLVESLETSIGDTDPFFYKDTSPSPDSIQKSNSGLLTPVLGGSPASQSLDSSLRSPGDDSTPLGSAISEDDMLMLSIDDVIADEELALRAPYIPMSDQDETLQLLISDDMVMWGPTQGTYKKVKWDAEDEISRRYADSSLAKLLKNSGEEVEKNVVNPVQVLGQTCRRGSSNKRHHGPNSPHNGNETKRIRSTQEPKERGPITASKIPNDLSPVLTGGGTTISELNSPMSAQQEDVDELRQQGNLLMEQLMGQQPSEAARQAIFEGRREELKDDDRGGGGGGSFNEKNVRQSNSVLMNLLVSGCDEIYLDVPRLLQDKRQPLMINTEASPIHDISRSYLTTYTMNAQSPSPKKLLEESISSAMMTSMSSTISPQMMEMSDYGYSIGDATPLSPGSELLRVLSEVV